MQNIHRIKFVITKVFFIVIMICGIIYISASLQDIKVRVNCMNWLLHEKIVHVVKVIDFFLPEGFIKKKRKNTKPKNLIIRAFSDVALRL